MILVKKKLKSESITGNEQPAIAEKTVPEAPQATRSSSIAEVQADKINLVEEDPIKEVQKSVKQTPPVDGVNNGKPISLPKTKKFLSIDSIESETEAAKNNSSNSTDEEKYTGEILILNQENILKLWDDYAGRISEDKRGLKIAFKSFKPILDPATLSKISVTVQSDIQKSQFDEVRLGLEIHLGKRTGTTLEIEVIADKEVSSGAKPYTPKEKLERMIQKNPAIKLMQQKLGLEIDYD